MYSSSNMLRARKKDASFKPNRILDKKSSRGMLYENEELRLRTIHINDEVERGHHDIKKLKKENDHLKREIWYLRDEYEKMEEKFNKVISHHQNPGSSGLMGGGDGGGGGDGNYNEEDGGAQGFGYDENGSFIVSVSEDGSPPDGRGGGGGEHAQSQRIPINYQRGRQLNRKISTATTTGSINSMYSSEDEEMNFILMIDDEVRSVSGNSCNMNGIQQQRPSTSSTSPTAQQPGDEYQLVQTEVESHFYPSSSDGPIPYVDEGSGDVYVCNPQTYHHYWHHMTSVPPELEDVKEESESTNNNVSPMSAAPRINGGGSSSVVSSPPSPKSNSESRKEEMQQLNNPSPNPTIEITPATTPNQFSSTNSSRETVLESQTSAGSPATGQRTQGQNNDHDGNGTMAQVQDLGCFTLIPEKFQVSSQVKISDDCEENEITTAIIDESLPHSHSDSKDLSKTEIHHPRSTKSANGKCSAGVRRRGSTTHRRNSLRRGSLHGSGSTQSQTLSFPERVAALASQTPFPSFYQSEPSLASHYPATTTLMNDSKGQTGSSSSRKYFDSSGRLHNHHPWPTCNSSAPIGCCCCLSCGDSKHNVVIGYIEDRNYCSLGVKEIIDQLETQFDPKLENISAGALKLLLEKGLSLNMVGTGEVMAVAQKIPIRLIDAATESSTIILAGLPPDTLLLDSAIISFLNQYGQVVGPFERRLYKGIDISECQIQIHLVRTLPSMFSINGYEIRICHKQESGGMVVVDACSTNPVCYSTAAAIAMPQNAVSHVSVHQPPPPPSASSYMYTSSSSPIPSPNASPNVTPQQTPVPQVKGGHNVVRRSASSASRLESGLNPNANAAVGQGKGCRKMSFCQDVLEEELIQQLANLSPNGGQQQQRQMQMQQQQQQQHGGSSSNISVVNPGTMSPQQQHTKRPLTRLPVSSPGNLAPETQQQQQQQYVQQHQPPLTSKPFYRSMSFDPRRNSTASRQEPNGGTMSVAGMGRLSVNEGQDSISISGTPVMNRRMYQMPQRNGNSIGAAGGIGGKLEPKNSTATAASDAHKPLPWCGCWGNGCL